MARESAVGGTLIGIKNPNDVLKVSFSPDGGQIELKLALTPEEGAFMADRLSNWFGVTAEMVSLRSRANQIIVANAQLGWLNQRNNYGRD